MVPDYDIDMSTSKDTKKEKKQDEEEGGKKTAEVRNGRYNLRSRPLPQK